MLCPGEGSQRMSAPLFSVERIALFGDFMLGLATENSAWAVIVRRRIASHDGHDGWSTRGSGMSEHHTGPVEVGAEMNYGEHEKTYNGFLALTKYGTMLLCVLMLAMVAGFFTTAGFLGGLVVFVVLSAAGFFLLR